MAPLFFFPDDLRWPRAVRPCEKTGPDKGNITVYGEEEGGGQNFHFNQNAFGCLI